jgi:WD40 repeat protein
VIVSGSRDQTVRVWDLASGAPIGKPLSGHTGAVRAVAAGELAGCPVIVSGGDDGTLRVWDSAGSLLSVVDVGRGVGALAMRSPTVVVGADAGIMALKFPEATRVR